MKRDDLAQSPFAGYAWMSLAVLMWASWLVLTSTGRTTSLSVLDLAGFRALIPALLFVPLLWRERRQLAKLGLGRCLLLSAYGAPFSICVGIGLRFAPVAHAGALVPGLMPVFAAALSAMFLGQKLTVRQKISFLCILLASVLIIFRTAGAPMTGDIWIGHTLFLFGALCWACFTVTVKTLDVSPYLATGIVGGVSTIGVAPFWIVAGVSNLSEASTPDIVFQAIFQGVLSGVVSLFAFGKALQLLGENASMLAALTPGVATLLAIPILNQVPDQFEVVAIFAVVTGLAVGSVRS